jgi:tRNA(fMet)-specific endonuclease VapC
MATRFLLDTNTIIAARKGEPTSLLNRLAGIAADRLCLSVIVLSELLTGAEKSRNADRVRAEIGALTESFELLPFSGEDAAAYGRLRATLESQGKTIGPMDMLIAAQALSRGLTVITANLREFQRVPRLKCENWLK